MEAAARHGLKVVFVSTSGTVGVTRDRTKVANDASPHAVGTIRNWPYYDSKRQVEIDVYVCVCVCVCVCTYTLKVHTDTLTHTLSHTHTNTYIHTHIRIYIHIYTYTHTYIHTYVYTYMSICQHQRIRSQHAYRLKVLGH
jgi:hypothetical protein